MSDETRKIILELSVSKADAEKQLTSLTKEMLKLKDGQKNLDKEFKAGKISLDQYSEATNNIKFTQDALGKQKRQLSDIFKAETGSVRELQAQYNRLADAIKSAQPGTKVLGMSMEEATKKAKALKDEIKVTDQSLGNFQGNVGDYAGQLSPMFGQLVQGFQGLQQGISMGVRSLGTLKGAIAATGIGILLLAFQGLVQYFNRTDEGADKLAVVTASLGAVMDVLVGIVGKLGEYLISAFENPKKAAGELMDFLRDQVMNRLKALSMAFNGFNEIMLSVFGKGDLDKGMKQLADASVQLVTGVEDARKKLGEMSDEMIKAALAAAELAKAQNKLEDAQRDFITKEAEQEAAIKRLIIQSKDRTKTDQERLAITDKISSKETSLLNQRIGLVQQEIDHIADVNKLKKEAGTLMDADELKYANALKKRIELTSQSDELQERNEIRRNVILDAIEEKRLKAINEQIEANKKLDASEEALMKARNDAQIKGIQEQLRNTKLSENQRLDLIKQRQDAEVDAELDNKAILLQNSELNAFDRERIELESQVRINQILFNSEEEQNKIIQASEEKKRAEKEKSAQAYIAAIGQLGQAASNLNQANLNIETQQLEKAKEAQLRAAGNNAKARERIEADFAKKKDQIEREAARKQQKIDLAMAVINTAVAVSKLLATPTLAVAAGIAGGAQVALIASKKFARGGTPKHGLPKFSDGGTYETYLPSFHKKNFTIQGKPHSQGGTKFWGEDGSVFEAERGEQMVIINKHDTPLLKSLSDINSVHGVPFFEHGGIVNKYADGGIATRAASESVVSDISSRNDLIDIVGSIQQPVLVVEEFQNVNGRQVKVKSRADV